MSTIEIVLAIAAFPIGLTGAWSPCGFSMVETVGMRGEEDAGRATFAACATFAPGAAVGGALTFGLLAVLGGAAHGVGGRAGFVVAAAIAVGAAILEARGVRIVPQIRRQLPESWRWRMPLPVAAGLYGVLLGLGFTTFVLSFGVWALAGISFALGDPATGLIIGLAFGIGRAIPVIVLAPLADHRVGVRCTEAMAERPALYRRARLGDALALGVAATALIVQTGAAAASHTVVRPGADPSVSKGLVAFQRPSGRSAVIRGGHVRSAPGREAALGGPYLADLRKGRVEVRAAKGLKRAGSMRAAGVDAMAISDSWLVILQSHRGRDLLKASRLSAKGKPGRLRLVTDASHPTRIGHPSLDGGTLAYVAAHPRKSQMIVRHLGTGTGGTAFGARRAQLTSPSVRLGRILFVRSVRLRQSAQAITPPPLQQSLELAHLDGHHARTLYTIDGGQGRLWSTALSAKHAYVTMLKGHRARIVRVARP